MTRPQKQTSDVPMHLHRSRPPHTQGQRTREAQARSVKKRKIKVTVDKPPWQRK